MRTFSMEEDYLVRAKPQRQPIDFRAAVKEAFLLEHGCQTAVDIARVLGVAASRISQIYEGQQDLRPSTVRLIIKNLKNIDQRRKVVRAWMYSCFGVDVTRPEEKQLTGSTVSEKTLRRVNRLIRQAQLRSASMVALEAANKTDDPVLREQFLDRAYFAHRRLDEFGQAMRVVRFIIEGARERHEPLREAQGHVLRTHILLSLGAIQVEETESLLALIETLVQSAAAPPTPRPPYSVCDAGRLKGIREDIHLYLMRQGMIPRDEGFVRQVLEVRLASLNKRLSFDKAFDRHLFVGNLFLYLGDTFAAAEHLDAAFNSGGARNVNAYEACTLLQGKILAKTEPPEVASQHFIELSRFCKKTQNGFHRRFAELELAQHEHSRCFINPDSSPG